MELLLLLMLVARLMRVSLDGELQAHAYSRWIDIACMAHIRDLVHREWYRQMLFSVSFTRICRPKSSSLIVCDTSSGSVSSTTLLLPSPNANLHVPLCSIWTNQSCQWLLNSASLVCHDVNYIPLSHVFFPTFFRTTALFASWTRYLMYSASPPTNDLLRQI